MRSLDHRRGFVCALAGVRRWDVRKQLPLADGSVDAVYGLEAIDGLVRKPDSLFMEATKS